MTIRDAQLELAKLGIVLNKTGYGNEFRVNFKGGSEATAYYTDDLEDAVGTGKHMGQQRQVQGSRKAAEEWESWNNPKLKETVRALLDSGDSPAKVLQILTSTHKIEKMVANQMIKEILDERKGVNGTRMNRFSASQTLDRVSDHLERLRKEIPREASNLRGLAIRLDRVANTLEAEQEATERVSNIENELDDLGVDFTVAPNSEGRQSTCIYAYKGQLNSHDEAAVLGRIAKKHGSTFENMRNNRTYKITVPHHV